MGELKWRLGLSSQSFSSHLKKAERSRTKADQEVSVNERQSKSMDHRGGRQRGKEYFKEGGGRPGHTCRLTRRSSLCTSRTTVTDACQPWPRMAKHQPAAPGHVCRSLAPFLRKDIGSQMKQGLTHFPVVFRLITTNIQNDAQAPDKTWHHPVF